MGSETLVPTNTWAVQVCEAENSETPIATLHHGKGCRNLRLRGRRACCQEQRQGMRGVGSLALGRLVNCSQPPFICLSNGSRKRGLVSQKVQAEHPCSRGAWWSVHVSPGCFLNSMSFPENWGQGSQSPSAKADLSSGSQPAGLCCQSHW